jgi:hypothetical protein
VDLYSRRRDHLSFGVTHHGLSIPTDGKNKPGRGLEERIGADYYAEDPQESNLEEIRQKPMSSSKNAVLRWTATKFVT